MEIFSVIRKLIGEPWLFLPKDNIVGPVACSAVLLLTAIAFVHIKACRLRSTGLLSKETLEPQATKNSNRNKDRRPGSWSPVQFTYPEISACTSEITDIKPIPYRPFRWGEYHVTMGIRSMPWNDWIELDNQFEAYRRIRAHRIRTRGEGVIRVLPDNPGVVQSGAPAAIELVHEIAEYLSRRYPTTFKISRHSNAIISNYGWEGAQPIQTITIVPLNVSYNLPLSVDEPGAAVRALEVATLITQEDLALMVEGSQDFHAIDEQLQLIYAALVGSDGKYYFQAGAICVPGFWRMQDKIGLSLDQIHITGDVPRYKEKLDMSMERFFQRMSVDKPVVRNNYFFQVVEPGKSKTGPINMDSRGDDENDDGEVDPEELAWSASTNGPEDSFIHGHRKPSRPTPTVADLRMRSERQTLRRLPQSGAIVFTIRTYLTPMEDLGREPGVPGRLASALRGWGRDIGIYKGKERGNWWDILLEYLDRCWDEQLALGVATEGAGKEQYPL